VTTTHSIDFVRALVANVNGAEDAERIAIYRIEKEVDGTRAKRYSGAQAQTLNAERQLKATLGFAP
jgi:hypothetical protein